MMVRLKTKNNRKSLQVNLQGFLFVRLKGLEPPRLSSPDPKSGAATNYATAAFAVDVALLFSDAKVGIISFFANKNAFLFLILLF